MRARGLLPPRLRRGRTAFSAQPREARRNELSLCLGCRQRARGLRARADDSLGCFAAAVAIVRRKRHASAVDARCCWLQLVWIAALGMEEGLADGQAGRQRRRMAAAAAGRGPDAGWLTAVVVARAAAAAAGLAPAATGPVASALPKPHALNADWATQASRAALAAHEPADARVAAVGGPSPISAALHTVESDDGERGGGAAPFVFGVGRWDGRARKDADVTSEAGDAWSPLGAAVAFSSASAESN
eukprot:4278965-Pleurochrysis_carterae.AAC.3